MYRQYGINYYMTQILFNLLYARNKDNITISILLFFSVRDSLLVNNFPSENFIAQDLQII